MPTIKEIECLRCSYKWYPEKPERPKVCPRCKSFNWNRPRKNKAKVSGTITDIKTKKQNA